MTTMLELLLTFLLNALWQIAVVAGFAFCASWLLRESDVRYCHGIWVGALVLSVALPLVGCAALITRTTAPEEPSASSAFRSLAFAPTDFAAFEVVEQSPPAASVDFPDRDRAQTPSAAIRINRKLAVSLSALFTLFLSYRAAGLLREWLRTRAILRRAESVEIHEPLSKVVRQCQAVFGVKRVFVFSSRAVAVPITAGIVNPLVVLPVSLLSETDEGLLKSAVGHELVHIARRDYPLNLIYELIYLPLSFHPAAALIRRNIRRTRELCCDQRVTEKLVNPELYARSLMRLIDAAPRPALIPADTTIGVAESSNLEVRIMTLLRKSRTTRRRKIPLLIASLFLLVVPCVAAARLAPSFEAAMAHSQEPASPRSLHQKLDQKEERVRQELERFVENLKQQAREAPESQKSEVEARLREVQKNLEEHERILQAYQGLNEPREAQAREYEEALMKLEATLAEANQDLAENETRLDELKDKLAEPTAKYPPSEFTTQQMEELLRFSNEIELQHREKAEKLKEDEKKLKDRELEELLKVQEKELSKKRKMEEFELDAHRKELEKGVLKKRKAEELDLEARRKFREERLKHKSEKGDKLRMKGLGAEMKRYEEELIRHQAELTRGANISMDRAIQIAISKHPGKVLSCRLNRNAANDQPFYSVTIITSEGEKNSAVYVWVSAVDGQILRESTGRTFMKGA